MTSNTPNFSEDPFELGSYHDIASIQGNTDEQARHFSLGFIWPFQDSASDQSRWQAQFPLGIEAGGRAPLTVDSIFIQAEGDHPIVKRKTVRSAGISVEIHLGKTDEQAKTVINFPSGFRHTTDMLPDFIEPNQVLWFISWNYQHRPHFSQPNMPESDARVLRSFSEVSAPIPGSRPIALAPVRTRPKRTYDPRTPTLSPEGDHTPMMLFNFSSSDEKSQGNMIEFGEKSGLFSDLRVRKFGEMGGEPFQIQAETHGKLRNIIDVGYGVSQALPILVDALNASDETMLLIQQPEVHLHPKAQAEMGTFFAEQMMQRIAPIIVETHSDYMIDRIRLLIRKGQVRKEDIRILFFSPQKEDVHITPIELGDDGSIIDPPEGYREFFLDEQFEFFS